MYHTTEEEKQKEIDLVADALRGGLSKQSHFDQKWPTKWPTKFDKASETL